MIVQSVGRHKATTDTYLSDQAKLSPLVITASACCTNHVLTEVQRELSALLWIAWPQGQGACLHEHPCPTRNCQCAAGRCYLEETQLVRGWAAMPALAFIACKLSCSRAPSRGA